MATHIKKSPKIQSFPLMMMMMITLVMITAVHSLTTQPLPRLPTDEAYPTAAAFPGLPLGNWELLHKSIGISAMHMQLLPTDQIIIFDRTDFGPSNLSLPSCPLHSLYSPPDNCTAHSLLYDLTSNSLRPLTVLTNTFCSSGSLSPSGTLVQTGGYARGERVVRTFTPCPPNTAPPCDWVELVDTSLLARRWYASNHLLPDGRIIVVGGRGSHSYEFFPKKTGTDTDTDNTLVPLRFLAETWDGRNQENNLYPFLHLLPNGNLYMFANNRSIEFDYNKNVVLREFPVMPFSERRNYPSTGSSVLLPIVLNATADDGNEFPELEVLICGGAPPEAYEKASFEKVYVEASRTCGRMVVTEDQPQWIMETMPMPRVMGDMVALPTGDVLVVNGAGNGSAGWENGENPVLNPVLYLTQEPDTSKKFVTLNPTRVPRMYHSCAVLVPDGRVVVGGSNPHPNYNFTGKYPTELSLEGFSPPYLDARFSALRPSVLAVEVEGRVVRYGEEVGVTYALGVFRPEMGLKVTLVVPAFATHSFGMNQRVVVLGGERVERLSAFAYKVTVRMPRNLNVAPPGFYMLFVVHAGVPSHGVWVQLKE